MGTWRGSRNTFTRKINFNCIDMDMIINVFNGTMTCLEGIFNNLECKIDSGCCQTHKQIHVSEQTLEEGNETNNDSKEKDLKHKISI